MSKPVIYEWVVVSSKGEDLYLTENQYKYFNDHKEDTFVDFDDLSIRPAFVVKAYKRVAEVIDKKYRCLECYGNGFTGGNVNDECPVCKGLGVNYGKV